MCELFAMSADQPVRLRYALSEFATHGGERYANRDGWGIVFTQARGAYLFKEPAAAPTSALERMVASHALRRGLRWPTCVERRPGTLRYVTRIPFAKI